MGKTLIFEIGTEEIPAGIVGNLRNSLAEEARNLLDENRIDFGDISVFSTPRRLVLRGGDLAEYQKDKKEVIRGPSEEIAYDEEGEPTRAALGFAEGQGVDLEEVIIRDGYLFVEKTISGKPTPEVLQDILPLLPENLSQPQTMRWGDKNFRFVRPIRWLLALLGDEVIEFELAELKSSRTSRGHRFLGDESIEIACAEDYFSRMEEEFVIVNQEKRKEMIIDQLKDLDLKSGKVDIDKELLEEVTNLVEYPTSFKGEFSSDFLDVPDEVLKTSMMEHQRYFPVHESGDLISVFAAVRNGNESHLEKVIKGNEMVIRARLADASFFYEEDCKISPDEFTEKLDDIVYQEELGSLRDKVERLKKLGKYLINELNFKDEEREVFLRAAHLSKFDLVTNMVEEFPGLQGVMGRIYAENAGENKASASAIEEHYLPKSAGGRLPESRPGSLLSLIDKIDDIVSNFFAGNKPSSSHDPFALRRKGLSIIRILLENDWSISLQEIISSTAEMVGAGEEVVQEVYDFVGDRLHSYLSDKGIRYDVISAVMAAGFDDIPDCYERCQAVMKLRNENPARFESIIHALQRCQNLALQGSPADEIELTLIETEEEENLIKKFNNIREKSDNLYRDQSYVEALKEISTLKEEVDSFLDNVVVMVDDADLKRNRLAVLRGTASLIEPVMDISEIALDEQ